MTSSEDVSGADRRHSPRSGGLRVIAAWAVVLAAVAFISRSLLPELVLFQEYVRETSIWGVVIAVFIAVPMYFIKAAYHLIVLKRISGMPVSWRKALPVYLQAQVVRYLPGKIWGLVYQSRRMVAEVGAGAVVSANLWQMLITNLLAMGVVLGVLLSFLWTPVFILLLVFSLIAVEWLHRNPIVESVGFSWLARMFSRFGTLKVASDLAPVRWRGTLLLCAEWVFYFLVFVVLLHGKLGVGQIVVVAAWYAGASILALAAFVVPGGLAVREAIFLAFPGALGGDAATLFLVAALSRVAFLGAEILAAVLASCWGGRSSD